jgi:hypothetical protein
MIAGWIIGNTADLEASPVSGATCNGFADALTKETRNEPTMIGESQCARESLLIRRANICINRRR